MHNHLDESHFRQNTQCPSGTEFYVCYANKFRGCCSTNPCDLQSCPDNSNPAESGGNPSEPQRTPTTASSAPTRDMHASWQSRTDAGPITTAQHPSTADEAPGIFTINSSTSFAQTGVDPPAETKGQGTPPPDSESNVLSVGAIVGITVGLTAAVVAFAFTITIWRSRRKGSRLSRHTDRGHDTPNTEHAPNQEYRVDIAQFPEECTAENQNPAVRVSSQVCSPPCCAIELDGGACSMPQYLSARATTPGREPIDAGRKPTTLLEGVASDPRATLNRTHSANGQQLYVNYWSQYATACGPGSM